MAEISLGAPGHGAGGNSFLLQGLKIITGSPVSFVFSHHLVAPESGFCDHGSTAPAYISKSLGNYNIHLGAEPTNTNSGSSVVCQ